VIEREEIVWSIGNMYLHLAKLQLLYSDLDAATIDSMRRALDILQPILGDEHGLMQYARNLQRRVAIETRSA
jgi:7-keto-8-aminopelargonate synthetase-like enzyme